MPPDPLTPRERALRLVLRLNGLITSMAILAVFLPLEWMHQAHQRLGMGAAPAQPIFEYLTRTLSFIYFIHGLLCLLLATDVRRFGPVITCIASLQIAFAVTVVWIDIQAGMPAAWTLIEAPTILLFAGSILGLRWKLRQA